MNYDEKLLKEDVIFPLVDHKYGTYLWDSEDNMIAMFFDKTMIKEMTGDYKVVDASTDEFELIEGFFVRKSDNKSIGMVRGWGRLQYKDNPEERQDNVAAYLLGLLNEKETV